MLNSFEGFIISFFAAMAELADALDSGSSRGNSVDVRLILAAMKNSSALIANGHIEEPYALRDAILQYSRIVAVDGGLLYCQQLGITPHAIVGDFDSCPEELLASFPEVKRTSLPTYKDETDLEVAIVKEREQGARSIALFGAWGKRIDHSLTNALILGRHPGIARIETERETLFAIQGTLSIPCKRGQTLSLIPLFGPARRIYSSGLEWELEGRDLDYGFIGVSNICLEECISLSIEEGLLLCSLLKTRTGGNEVG